MSNQQDPSSGRFLRDDESQLAFKNPQRSQGRRLRRRRIGLFLLGLLLLLAGGIYAFQRFNSSGLPSPAGADGVANFRVGTHPVIVINGANRGINVHANSLDHVVTLRAVNSANDMNNTAIPYTQSSDGRTYTFDVSSFSDDALDLAVPALTDLQVTATDGPINVNGVSGQMVLGASNAAITIIGATLDGSSSLNANNGGLTLNTVTFSGGANLVGSGTVTLTNVHFHGPATLGASGAVALTQDTFADTATLESSNGDLSVSGTTFAGAASLTVETSGHLTTTNTTFNSTALLSAANGAITFTSTTFAGAVTVTDVGTFATTQTTFQAGATVKASRAMNTTATFSAQGNYQFIVTDGDIDLTLSSELSFHLDASASNGPISSDFPTIHVTTNPNTNAVQAHGDVGQNGNASKLKFTLTADNGAVRIHKV